jgi:hypothetical protein
MQAPKHLDTILAVLDTPRMIGDYMPATASASRFSALAKVGAPRAPKRLESPVIEWQAGRASRLIGWRHPAIDKEESFR